MDLTDEQWTLIEPLMPKLRRRPDGRGRPWRDTREVLHGVLWVLRTGAPWKDMPERYPSYQTCHRRFQQWVRTSVFEKILISLAEDLQKRGRIDLTEAFIDGSFTPAKKGGLVSIIRNAERGARSWQLQTAMVFLSPLAWTALRPAKSLGSRTPSINGSPCASRSG